MSQYFIVFGTGKSLKKWEPHREREQGLKRKDMGSPPQQVLFAGGLAFVDGDGGRPVQLWTI